MADIKDIYRSITSNTDNETYTMTQIPIDYSPHVPNDPTLDMDEKDSKRNDFTCVWLSLLMILLALIVTSCIILYVSW